MKFSPGDKVVLKRTGEEGTVAGFIGNDMLEVEVGGTVFPVYTDEVDHPYLRWFTEKSKQKQVRKSVAEELPVEQKMPPQERLAKGLYLSFMPVFKTQDNEDIVDFLKIFVLNESPSTIRFTYEVKVLDRLAFRHHGLLHPFSNLYLHSIAYEEMNDQPRFHWSAADAEKKEMKQEQGVLRIKPPRLFGHINDLLKNNQPTFSYLLLEGFVVAPAPEKKVLAKPAVPSRPPQRQRMSSFSDLPRTEVDLHIEALLPDHKGMSPSEMLALQLSTLQRYLDIAVRQHQEKMIVIHGVGKGVLREAVHQLLRDTSAVKSFRNEYMGKYGFGATEIIFHR